MRWWSRVRSPICGRWNSAPPASDAASRRANASGGGVPRASAELPRTHAWSSGASRGLGVASGAGSGPKGSGSRPARVSRRRPLGRIQSNPARPPGRLGAGLGQCLDQRFGLLGLGEPP